MNSKIIFFTLLSAFIAQDAGSLPQKATKCLEEKKCGVDMNCIQKCFPDTQLTPELAQTAVDCIVKQCGSVKEDPTKLVPCVGTCYANASNKDKKEGDNKDKENKDKENKDQEKKDQEKKDKEEKPKVAEVNKPNNANTLVGSAAFALVLSAISMAL